MIDGRSGRTGQLFIERVKAAQLPCELTAIGTNAIATSAMLKAGADAGATGENPVVVACRKADVIVGPIGILTAMPEGDTNMWIGIILVCFVLPAILTFLFGEVLRKMGWIKEGDLKLDL